MADHEEDAPSQSMRRSTRTTRRPPRFTEKDEGSGVDGATLEDVIDGLREAEDESSNVVLDRDEKN